MASNYSEFIEHIRPRYEADFLNHDSKNARLIAAAPEMYGELYDCLQLVKGHSSYDGDDFSQQAASIQELLARIDREEVEA